MIDISIVVVSYNHEKYIANTLESLVNQETNFNYEILVGDDCSKDNTLKVILEYQSKYPMLIRNVKRDNNLGATTNLYDLMQHARGRYIAFCEGDDYWCDKFRVQREIDFLDSNRQYSGVCGRTIPVDENNGELSVDFIDETKKFWIFKKTEFTQGDYEQWLMPGHLSALTMRNYMLDDKHNYSVVLDAHKLVADRTLAMICILNGVIKCETTITSCYRFIIKPTGNNFMSQINRTNYRLDDFVMLIKQEKYAKSEFGIPLSLDIIKKNRLVGATVVWLTDRNEDNKNVLKGIINESGQKGRYTLYMIVVILKKLFYWKILKTDKRVTI